MTNADGTPIEVAIRTLQARIDGLRDDDLSRATPCTDWNVGQLVDHVITTTDGIATMLGGGEPDWTASRTYDDRSGAFREASDRLLGASATAPPDQLGMPLSELAVHTWDLEVALGGSTDELDPRVAESGLAFMHEHLTDEQRAGSFDLPREAPADANAYERIAAFAGRAPFSPDLDGAAGTAG